MPVAVKIRTDHSVDDLRRLAARSKDANQTRRLLTLAADLEGRSREEAARIGGMDRQTLRDWVHRFNAHGPDGLTDRYAPGPQSRLTKTQLAELAEIVETGPDRAKDGVVRWRRIDLKKVVEERFGVVYHQRTIGKILKQLGFSHISARPRHPGQRVETLEAFKKLSRDPEGASGTRVQAQAHRNLVPGRSPDRTEEWDCPAMGQARHTPSAAGRSAL